MSNFMLLTKHSVNGNKKIVLSVNNILKLEESIDATDGKTYTKITLKSIGQNQFSEFIVCETIDEIYYGYLSL